ncbi:MAG: type VII secretion protein EccB [Streptosporangiales bacterium]|nr:type VII secretion protein EccB [Streptosporangiales bacterium]
MRSRKEQLQAYQFLRRRIGAALLSGEPDTLDPPMRRVIRTSFAGFMVGAIIIAAFALYGVFRPGGATGWKDDRGSLVVEKDTGAAYVYMQGNLHPMLNYASARLYLGQPDAEPRRVSSQSLRGTPRAEARGIPNAPHSLPDPKRGLVTEPWTVCAQPMTPDASTVTLLAGSSPPGGSLAPDEGLVVTGGGQTYLVWRNARYLVPDPGVLVPIGLNPDDRQEVGEAWLNALPEGPELVFPSIPQLGQPGPSLPNGQTTVGEIYFVDFGDRQEYFLVMPDGLAQISKIAADIISSDPDVAAVLGGGVDASPLGRDDLTQAPRTRPPGNLDRYPTTTVKAANLDRSRRGVLCVSLSNTTEANAVPTVSAVSRAPEQGETVERPPGSVAPTANNFFVEPGQGAVVGAVPHPNVRTNAFFLITDRGLKFPIANDDSLEALGYGDSDIARLPTGFLEMLPTGPTLSRQAASQMATGSSSPEQAPQTP